MEIQAIPLAQLAPHPSNSNVMPPELLQKLAAHLERSDRYPPVIVRPVGAEGYQILDGHHRVRALAMIGRSEARCVVWQVDDAEALLLMATLNRLQGRDDPRKRAALLDDLATRSGPALEELAQWLPERLAELQSMLALNKLPEPPRMPRPLSDMPVAVHFFLRPSQRDALEKRLAQLGGEREEALMKIVGG